MKPPAWRGLVVNGTVWAWPTLLFQHKQAFAELPLLAQQHTCRWRQWEPGGRIDFDPGSTAEDRVLVEHWVRTVSESYV